MKAKQKPVILMLCVFIVLIVVSFCAGRYMAQREYAHTRSEQCSTLIEAAIEAAERDDFADSSAKETLISNVYAAYQFCDDTKTAKQLLDLWNYLVFESDNHSETASEIALNELNDALRAIKASK